MQQNIKEIEIKKTKEPELRKKNLIDLVSIEQDLIQFIIKNEGEITEKDEEHLQSVHEALMNKIDGYDLLIRNLPLEAEKYAQEAKFYASHASRIKKTEQWLKDRLKNALISREGGCKGLFKDLFVREGKDKVNLITENAKDWLGKNYDDLIRKKVRYEFDKEAIREAIKNGRELPFATLEESWNLRRSANTSLGKRTKK